ncbi:MAG: metallophosphoesterase [Clostridiaceae bacterium]|nr:metallophosphoesterase [Clostridiaceae bacterium]
MALFVLGDTHLSEGCDKAMDVFGGAWRGYREKLLAAMSALLGPEDTLVLCGDISWGMTLSEALPDFALLDGLPGHKLLLKGNHDYWWETVSKMKCFFTEHGIHTLDFLHNNCFSYQDIALCGTRGWFYDPNDPAACDDRIFKRELIRLEASLKCGAALQKKEIFCFLHYPPVFSGSEVPQITALLRKYSVSRCFYGHLHGESLRGAFSGQMDGIVYRVVSADALGFTPLRIAE